jgi:tetratricopeptide (TPR) repeat protein
MSTGSSRFRTAQVTAPATPAERLRRTMDDPDRFVEVALELLEPLARELRGPELLELMAVVREHPDHHRSYLLHRLTAGALIDASHRLGVSDAELQWAAAYDISVEMLMGYLAEHPHEPELLNLLGLAYFELGETAVARRLFEAVREIEPEHTQARGNVRACKGRDKATGFKKVPAELMRRAQAHHAAAKRLADLATRLPERTVSLCMIVKDEEEMLPGCLEAVVPWVDEVIVCDTGSSDSTREIALEHGATLLEFPWNGSFSDARNHALDHATGDWILYLDADEHLIDEDGAHLKQLARKTWIEGFYLVENHFTGEFEMGGQTSHMAMRLFQRRPLYRWEGIVHEQKLRHFPVYLPERFQNTPVRMNHYGYLKRVVEDRSKRERNLELLHRQLEERESAFVNFNIGSEHAALQNWADARPFFERALELSRAEDSSWWVQQFAPMMVARLVTSRRGTGDDDGALAMIDEALGYWPQFTDLEFERAVLHAQAGNVEEARAATRRCLEMGDAPARFVAVQGRGTFQARAMLASIERSQGNVREARELLEAAFAEAPQFLPLVLELADVMLLQESPEEVARDLEAQLGERLSSAHVNLMLATAFYESGHLTHADRFYVRALEAAPDNAVALIGRAELALAEHRPADALELCAQIDPLDPMMWRGARTWFLAAVVAGSTAEAERALKVITDAGFLPIGQRSFYSAWYARLTGGLAVLSPDNEAAAQAIQNLEALAKLAATVEFEQLLPLLEQALPDERQRRLLLGSLYLRRRFADMAAGEFMYVVEHFGPDAESLTALGKVATLKEMWDDAQVFLSEAISLDPERTDARKLLQLIRDRQAG